MINGLGMGIRRVLRRDGTHAEHVLTQHPLRRVLAFTGISIDDVVNSPVAKNQVMGYYRLHCQIQRQGEVSDLERQWNGAC